MIFKNKDTFKQYRLISFSIPDEEIILDDCGKLIFITLESFYSNYEYVWMPNHI